MRLMGNLPYNISTPLIFHLLTFAKHISDMHFMLQKEVVDRLAARVGSDAIWQAEYYGAVSLPSAFIIPCGDLLRFIRHRKWIPVLFG